MARYTHTAWTPQSLPNSIILLGGRSGGNELLDAETVPGVKAKASLSSFQGGAFFNLRHRGEWACGIPDGETLVSTGGILHNYVTRYRSMSKDILIKRKDCNHYNLMMIIKLIYIMMIMMVTSHDYHD